jgi:hypothetical protein
MVSREVAALFMEQMPDDKIRSLRDSIARQRPSLPHRCGNAIGSCTGESRS